MGLPSKKGLHGEIETGEDEYVELMGNESLDGDEPLVVGTLETDDDEGKEVMEYEGL